MSGPKTEIPTFTFPQLRQDIASTRPSHPTSNGTATPARILIYEALILFLKDACSAGIPGQSLSEVAGVQEMLDSYPLSISFDSAVSSIVESLQCRKTLLELASKLGLANDPRLRSALHLGEKRIAALLVSIFNSKSEEDTVLRLRGHPAQYFLDVVQDALDRGFLMAPEHSRMARRIVRKLSEACDQLPSSIFITGITGREEYRTFGGGFGDIYRASCGDEVVALKYMRAVHFLRGDELRRLRLKFCREVLVWKDLHHPHILPFMGIDRNSYPSSLCMVSPWMEHGTVLKYLRDHGRTDVDKLLYEIAQGLEYLHLHDVVHGDLRGSNILITQDWSACLADFGLSAFADATSSLHTSNRAGSLNWMAPELLDPGPFGLKFSRTAATDVYAFGCVCFELYTGRPPFAELGPATLMKVVTGERPERPSDAPLMSDALWQHVTGYWGQTPSARPTSSIVVQDMVWPLPGSKARRPLPPLPLSAPSTVSARSNTASRSIHGTTSVSPVKVSPARTPPGESTAWFSTNDDEIDRGGSQRRLARPKRPSVQDIMNSFNSPPAPGLASALSPHHDESDHSHSVPERHHRRQRGRGKGKEHRREDDIHVISPLAVPTDHLVGNTSSHSRSPSPEDMLRLQHETRPVLPVLRLSDTQDGSPGLHSRSASDTPHLRPVYVRSRVRSASLGDVPRLYEAKTLDDYDVVSRTEALDGADKQGKRWRAIADRAFGRLRSPTLLSKKKWWPSKKADGSVGITPFYLQRVPSSPSLARAGNVPTSDGQNSLHQQFKAKALLAYTANESDPNEISFNQGETFDVIDAAGEWWQVQKKDGAIGSAPSQYLQVLPEPSAMAGLSTKHTVVALSRYTAHPDDPTQISFNKGEILELVENHNHEWWRVKKADGSVGLAPAKRFAPAKRPTPANRRTEPSPDHLSLSWLNRPV